MFIAPSFAERKYRQTSLSEQDRRCRKDLLGGPVLLMVLWHTFREHCIKLGIDDGHTKWITKALKGSVFFKRWPAVELKIPPEVHAKGAATAEQDLEETRSLAKALLGSMQFLGLLTDEVTAYHA